MKCLPLIGLLLMLLFSYSNQATLSQHSGRVVTSFGYLHQVCRDAETGRELLVGEMFTRPGQCVRLQCLGTLQLWEDNCQVPRNLKGDCQPVPVAEPYQEFPKCCPLYVCKSFKSNAQGQVEQTNTYDHYGTLRESHLTELIVINRELRPGGHSAVIPTAPIRKYYV